MFPKNYQNEKLADFIVEFYAASDTRPPASEDTGHDRYVDFFTKDAQVHIRKDAHGHKELFPFRRGMWENIATREHTIYQVYPFTSSQDNQQELVVRGNVRMVTEKEGNEISSEWTARMVFEPNPSGANDYRMEEYKVYMA